MITICDNMEKCTACGACANICPKNAINFKENEYGIEYPQINQEECVDCGLCKKICNLTSEINLNEPLKAVALTNKDFDVTLKSSSGGVFSAFAEYILENNGAVCGCVYDENLKPIHICSEKKDDYFKMRKSKYVRSDIGYVYRQVKERLSNGQTVLFTGTPCQVSGLKAFVGKEYESLITADLVCHGVPEVSIFNEFIKYLEQKHKTKIVKFDFRSKKYGWQRFTMEYTDDKGKVKNIGKNDEFYMAAFSKGNIMRPNCYDCKYATRERVGDITLGDLWGHEKIDLKCDRINGISLCTFNNTKAIELFDKIKECFVTDEIDYNLAVQGNTCLRKPTSKGSKWERYMNAYKNDEVAKLAELYRKNNKKFRLRGKIKLLLPIKVVNLAKKFHL